MYVLLPLNISLLGSWVAGLHGLFRYSRRQFCVLDMSINIKLSLNASWVAQNWPRVELEPVVHPGFTPGVLGSKRGSSWTMHNLPLNYENL